MVIILVLTNAMMETCKAAMDVTLHAQLNMDSNALRLLIQQLFQGVT
jgi:hypothetical protein